MELFVFEKTKNFILPTSYDRYDNGVNGIFTSASIRFYKKALESIITYNSLKEKYPEKESKEIRMILRSFNRLMETFSIDENGIVKMKVDGTEHKRKFKFSKGLILVKGESFIDVTNKDHLHEYIMEFGFDEQYESDILKNDITTLHRNPSKKLLFDFK